MRILNLFCFLAAVSAAIVGVDLGHHTMAVIAPDLVSLFPKPKEKDGVLDDADRDYGFHSGCLTSRNPESCIANFKDLLGKTIDKPAVRDYYASQIGMALVGNPDRNDSVAFEMGSGHNRTTFSTEEATAMYLNYLKERALKNLSDKNSSEVIAEDIAVSIAPFASQNVRLAYLEALQLANYSSILGLVDEGTAVALHHMARTALTREELDGLTDGKTVYNVIYDIGDGSTTATLFSYTLKKGKRGLQIVLDFQSVGFDKGFGGDFLTFSVCRILFVKFAQQFEVNYEFDELPPILVTELFAFAERAKIDLSAKGKFEASSKSFYDDKDFKVVITREEFEEYNIVVFERAMQPILDALANAVDGPKSVADIKSVILNGGASITPFIKKQLVSFLGVEEKIKTVVETDVACASGTALRGLQLKDINSAAAVFLVNDRIFSNFEVGINDADNPALVFAKGTIAGNRSEVALGPVTEDSIEVGLYENGVLFKSYPISGLTKKVESLKCARNEAELLAFFFC